MADTNNSNMVTFNAETEQKIQDLKLNSMCSWEKFVTPAPTSIAILGHLMALTAQKDFKLNVSTSASCFQHLKYPGSFRGCLVQITNSACEAFKKAHNCMEKIGLQTKNFHSQIKSLTELLSRGIGNNRNKGLFLILNGMKKEATQCLENAKAVEESFNAVMCLIDETIEASAAVKGVYEDNLSESNAKQERLNEKDVKMTNIIKQMEEEQKRANEEIDKAKNAYEKSINDVPGVAKLLAMHAIEETINVATSSIKLIIRCKMAAATGGMSLLIDGASDIFEIGKGMKKENKLNLHVAFQHASEIYACVETIYNVFMESTDSEEMKVDLETHSETLNEIRDDLVKLKENYEHSEFAKDGMVLQAVAMCEKGTDLCNKIQEIKEENAGELFKQSKSLKDEAKGFQIKARAYFGCSSILIPESNQESKSKTTAEIASENARYEVEFRKKELDDTKRAREKIQDELKKMEDSQYQVLKDLRKTESNSVNFEEIQKSLREGLQVLSQLKAQWNLLVLFFMKISNGIEICLHQKTATIGDCLEKTELDNLTTQIVLEMATSVGSVAFAVNSIAETYVKISENHIIQKVANISGLLALETTEIDKKRKDIDNDHQNAEAEILGLVRKSRTETEQTIRQMYENLEKQRKQLPELPDTTVSQIKEDK